VNVKDIKHLSKLGGKYESLFPTMAFLVHWFLALLVFK
jgi:hypothetical protein